MILLLSWLGGVLTILSPCILPVLPFVFARADRPFLRNGLPMLAGMAAGFAAIASLAAVAGGWAVRVNQAGRVAALLLMALFGLALLLPMLADRLARPLVAIGARLSRTADRHSGRDGAVLSSLLLGVATGLLWAPCAGPILGLLLTGAAIQGATVATSLLLFAYAAGAATSLGLALLAGGRVLAALKRVFGIGEWVRRGLGVAVLAAVAVVALGLDTRYLVRASSVRTVAIERALIDAVGRLASDGGQNRFVRADMLPVEGLLPELDGAVAWLNAPPLTPRALRGKVVLVNFWTYSCINCLRSLPYTRAWAQRYRGQGLVVIGVHAPEFAFEKDIDNVRQAARSLGLDYPIAIDNRFAIWRAFDNGAWPAFYLIDTQGRIRYHQFGEGDYPGTERAIRSLLAENGRPAAGGAMAAVDAPGAQAPADWASLGSPEAYLGFAKAVNFASPGGIVRDRRHGYGPAPALALNHWSLAGDWTILADRAALAAAGGRIAYRFHARDLHLVMGPAADCAVRFRVSIDGHPPGADHGADIDAAGNGLVTGQRLYQLIRQKGAVADRDVRIDFLDPGAEAFVFTFG